MTGLLDLHRHLDGSLRLQTLRELADAKGVMLPRRVGFFEHPLPKWLELGVQGQSAPTTRCSRGSTSPRN